MNKVQYLAWNLIRIKNILDDMGVWWVISWGMALGAYRDGQIIPWDNDVDVGVIVEREFPIDLLLEIRSRLKPEVAWISCEVQVPDKPDLPTEGTSLTFCFEDNSFSNQIEFCVLTKVREKVIAKYYCPKGIMHFPEHMFRKLNTIEFIGKTFFIPSDTEKYLERCYGKDWRMPKKEGWNKDMVWDEKN